MAASSSLSPDTGEATDDGDRVSIGATLDGRYRIDALIGTGGMGRVYRAEHTGIGRAVAIKILHNDLNHNREAAQRFQREAIASGRLDHPNIVGIYDFGVLPHGACYLVMELLEGETLGARLERDGRLVWRDALDVLRGVLLGLRHAHERGVVHRDIKPDNIYLARKDGDLIIKLLDFGIAKLRAGSADDPASTRAGLTVGTPAYLSPEQAVGGEITPASDLYSATIVLYEMLAGRGPFEDKDPLAMLGAHVSRTPPTVSQIAPDIELPQGLEAVISAGLLKTAADRTRTAQEYIALIDRVIASTRRFRTAPVATPSMVELAALGVPMTPPSGTPVARPGMPSDPSLMIVGDPHVQIGQAATQTLPVAGADGLPQAVQPVALGEATEMIPRRWIVIGGIVIVLLVIGAVVLALTSSGNYAPSSAAGSGQSEPRAGGDPEAERELKLKALVYDLQNGETCAERKAAIARLVELGDKRAIGPLRLARFRTQSGAGSGGDNVNACLTRDADAAIKALSGPPAKSG